MDHREWNIADARNRLIWQVMYLDIIPSMGGIQTPQARDIRIQLTNAPTEEEGNQDEENENEENEEMEEEEDPEEDLKWDNEVVPRTPTAPIMIEENLNQVSDQVIWDFDRELDILDSSRMEPEVDLTVWKDIYDVNEQPQAVNEVIPEPMKVENEEEVMMREARLRLDRTGRKQEEN